jgi:DNA-binding MarR family transcriptional regulator
VTEPRWLSDTEMRTWLGYRRMRRLLDLKVNRDLAADAGLSEQDYDVLSILSDLPDQRLRVGELSERLWWTRSGLSRHLGRMEQRGLVAREDDPDDARATVVTLTNQGRDAIADAAPGHVASVRRHLIDRLTPAELQALGDIAAKVLDD